MGYNGVAPQDRAMAQLQIVMGSLVTLGGIAGLLFVDLSFTGRRGIPMWVLIPAVILFGISIVWNGIRMWRRNGPSEPGDKQSTYPEQNNSGRATRVARSIPTAYFAGTGAVGAIGSLAGAATFVVGLISGDSNLVSTGLLIGVGGVVVGLVGISAAAYFRSVNSPDRG